MVDRVVLHIGTMKSGTTYVQRVLDTGVLESVGGFYAGGSFKAQSWAVDKLLRQAKRGLPGAWHDLAAKVQRRDGTAFFSHEFLSFAPEGRVRQIVESFDGTPVEVLLTVRDQHTAMPAQWQTSVRNRGTDPWDTYVRRLDVLRGGGRRRRARRPPPVQRFCRAQYVPDIVARWRGQPGVTSVGVVLVPVPGSPPQLLWQRFCEAARIEAPEPPQAVTRQNESLGYASCELLRRLNQSLAGLTGREHERARKAPVQALLPLRAHEQRPVLDESGGTLARELNRRILRVVSADGVRLVGCPDELPVADRGGEPPSIPPPDPGELRRALETAWASCVPGVAPPSGDLDDGVSELGRRLATRFGP